MISLSDTRVASIPILENGEPLIDIGGQHGRLRVDDSPTNIICLGYVPTYVARETVVRKLVEAAASLPVGYSLLVKESLRPAQLQRQFFERRLKRMSAENPALTEQEAITLASQFVAPPWVAGHPSGGAIDLTLCDQDGQEVDMGCGYDEDEATSNGACFSGCEGLLPAARRHRELMFAALTSVGFVNYPFEWWHWSYGDRYWAVVECRPHALYGPIEDVPQQSAIGECRLSDGPGAVLLHS
jgi:D-alanyl-D-alanine dipeptidase